MSLLLEESLLWSSFFSLSFYLYLIIVEGVVNVVNPKGYPTPVVRPAGAVHRRALSIPFLTGRHGANSTSASLSGAAVEREPQRRLKKTRASARVRMDVALELVEHEQPEASSSSLDWGPAEESSSP